MIILTKINHPIPIFLMTAWTKIFDPYCQRWLYTVAAMKSDYCDQSKRELIIQ